jgi:uroporphyrinogen-III decarboxylase
MAAFGAFMGQMAGMGYPVAFVGVTKVPFDTVSDDYRGLRGSTLDLYRQPDKLQALMEMLTPMVIGQAIGAARGSGNPRVFIPLHRGAAGFLNDEQFAKYYWPGVKAVIFALLEAGVTPCPFFEGDYAPRLKYLAELPPGVVAAHFDRTDRKKFKEVCGHNLCFWGDVPGSLMVTGKPSAVKDYVKGLIEDFADTGGLIVDGANSITGEAKPENVMALREAVDEYGVY